MYSMGKWERKFGKYAIPNLSLYLIICYGAGYLLQMINPQFVYNLALNPYMILQGEVWRIFTWILVPSSDSNIFFVLISMYCFYSIGRLLERAWGSFYFNVYVFAGILFTILGAFLLYGYICLTAPGNQMLWVGNVCFTLDGMYSFDFFSLYYISMALFLGLAVSFPDMQVLLMMIIPIKVKWSALIYIISIVYDVVSMGRFTFTMGVSLGVAVGASLLNFLLVFLLTRKKIRRGPRQTQGQRMYHREVKTAERKVKITRHKCAICGRTEEEYPNLEFRFCSKCDGNYEYCADHLFTHQHIRRDN
ncbi:MAG: hypothetical protein IJX86_10815 [Lachnospiraceae bacterium]|nr:hypothetical protein [Lachnospiraceae bacterium]